MRKTKKPLYQTWQDMHQRCYNTKHKWYPKYGGRGIKVCNSWHNFDNFITDVGLKPNPKLSLDRIDNNGNYEPTNVRWADSNMQARNKSSTRYCELNGEILCLKDYCVALNVNYATIKWRLQNGWSTLEAFKIPIGFAKMGDIGGSWGSLRKVELG